MGCCEKKKPQRLLEKNPSQKNNEEDSSELSTIKISYSDFTLIMLLPCCGSLWFRDSSPNTSA